MSTIYTQPKVARRVSVKSKKPDKTRGTSNHKKNDSSITVQLDPSLVPSPPITVGYTTLAMLDLMADAYSKVWEYYLKDLYNPLVDVVKDIFAHNRLSKNLVDPKMRSVFEFFTAITPATAYNVRKYNLPTVELSAPNSRCPSRSSTPRKDSLLPIATTRPSTTGNPQLIGLHHSPKKPLLHSLPPAADYPAANTHLFLFGRMLGLFI